MSKRSVKVPAEEYARRYGWRPSAVVHRIRAGIYDGVHEQGRWFVLQPADPDATGEEVGEFEKTPPGYAFTPPRLPWATTPGTFRWVTALQFTTLLILGALLLLPQLNRSDLAPGAFWIGVFAAGAYMLGAAYEGLRTGAVRSRSQRVVCSDAPLLFTLLVGTYALGGLAFAIGVIVKAI